MPRFGYAAVTSTGRFMKLSAANSVAYPLLIMTTLFWGGNAVAGKLAVDHIPPMLLTLSRWTVAFLIMSAIGWPQLKREWPVVRAHLPRLLLYGMFGFAIFNIALYSAVRHTSAINVAIEQSAIPMLVFVANFLLFGVRVRAAQMVGFAMSIAGIATVASHGDWTRLIGLDINRGDAIMLLAILAYGGYTVAIRFKPPINWKTLMIVMTFSAALTSLPFAVWEMRWGGGFLPDRQGLAVAAYTAIFPSILAQIFYIRGIELIGSNRAGLFINLVPVFGTLLAIAIAGESLRLYHVVALALVIGGILLAERAGAADAASSENEAQAKSGS